MIKDDLPRGSWRTGRIQELISSRDGHIRSATVLLPSKKMIGRPLSLLFPIECQATDINTDSLKQDSHQTVDRQHDVSQTQTDKKGYDTTGIRRPKRLAANTARQRIKEQLNND